ncbi:saccharopine dehydrogenase NADP-binding domain-containing protein [Dactylosporangium fulvum]|uniref:Saccharopine dehydrogenase NADP-binding domain-containing protein n=1 Tax=Dactylosporangium fulvum TaxID=53359 RepID=A0ABY5WE78_9ACTN|nr:saccharopine dehydrogenase NADP-binding domain-containing protein [Dactylosporangium fulvum]UWP87656.1 saccharopine dehydrogenase NADP-binding domain-containing protein [Dactylosporangium fulvum]
MVYGANGYSGRLLARLAVDRGERPVLAGRSRSSVAPLAAELGLSYRIGDPATVPLDGVDTVANCAGPFAATAAPLVACCLSEGKHYLDITGELDVFDRMFAQDAAARAAGVVMITGAGFDVVPTDCLAAVLAAAVPDAVALELAFHAPGGLSRGTARTALSEAAAGGLRRVDGVLVPTRFGTPSREVPFPSGPRTVGATRWGDLVTAYRSTGIPNITVYTHLPRNAGSPLVKVLGFGPLRALAQALVRRGGPSAQRRSATGCEVWAEVRDAAGNTRSATLTGPNAYALTADATLRAVREVRAGTVPAGVHTPSQALGADFVRRLSGVEVHLS